MSFYHQKGFSMVEVIVSIAMAAVVALAISQLNFQTMRISTENITGLQANMYLLEAVEVVKDLEISNWQELDNCEGETCYPQMNIGSGDNRWELVTTDPGPLDGKFTRGIRVEGVDPNTLIVTTEVFWDDSSGPKSIELETYVYDIF